MKDTTIKDSTTPKTKNHETNNENSISGSDSRRKVSLIEWIVPKFARLPLFLIVVINFSAYFLSRLVTAEAKHYDLSLPIDRMFPRVPWTVLIYFGCYLFWIANYIMACRLNKKQTLRFACADIMAKLVCFMFFIFLPTTMPRPEVTEPGAFNSMLAFLYQIDPADNLFPSIHCLVSWFCFIGIRAEKSYPTWYKVASVIMALSVCVSTLTTRQHVIVDVFAGLFLAELTYLISGLIFHSEQCSESKSPSSQG